MKDEEKWQEHCDKWKASGKSQREYSKGAGINFHVFKNNIYRLRKQARKKIVKMTARSEGFQGVEVIDDRVKTTDKQGVYCKIIFGETEKVEISSQESLVRLRELMGCRA